MALWLYCSIALLHTLAVGFEVMRMIRKRQCLMLEPGSPGDVRFVKRLFRLAARSGDLGGASCATGLSMQQSRLRHLRNGTAMRSATI
jgi:hypothetical protein